MKQPLKVAEFRTNCQGGRVIYTVMVHPNGKITIAEETYMTKGNPAQLLQVYSPQQLQEKFKDCWDYQNDNHCFDRDCTECQMSASDSPQYQAAYELTQQFKAVLQRFSRPAKNTYVKEVFVSQMSNKNRDTFLEYYAKMRQTLADLPFAVDKIGYLPDKLCSTRMRVCINFTRNLSRYEQAQLFLYGVEFNHYNGWV